MKLCEQSNKTLRPQPRCCNIGRITVTFYKHLSKGRIKTLRFYKRDRFRISETDIARLLEAKEVLYVSSGHFQKNF